MSHNGNRSASANSIWEVETRVFVFRRPILRSNQQVYWGNRVYTRQVRTVLKNLYQLKKIPIQVNMATCLASSRRWGGYGKSLISGGYGNRLKDMITYMRGPCPEYCPEHTIHVLFELLSVFLGYSCWSPRLVPTRGKQELKFMSVPEF